MPPLPQIQIADFHYELPDHRIAKFPLEERSSSRLLLAKSGLLSQDVFRNICTHLPAGALLVFNNTRVIHARLRFQRSSGAAIEIFCLEPAGQVSPEESFSTSGRVEWNCLVGNLKRWKDEVLQSVVRTPERDVVLEARLLQREEEGARVALSWDHPRLTFSEILEIAGELPIPPYLNRETEAVDEIRYNTIYASQDGSVAAPTAGLHFTDEILDELPQHKIKRAFLTLHVGAGTFKPVKTALVADHEMHEERFMVSRDFITALIVQVESGAPVVAVGTTSMRTLESLYWLGVQLASDQSKRLFQIGQWEPYEATRHMNALESFGQIASYLEAHGEDEVIGYTGIIIVPGYQFRVVDALITNFHQPASTLLLLIAAFIGNTWREAYDYALKNDFRFLSYGDSSLLWRKNA